METTRSEGNLAGGAFLGLAGAIIGGVLWSGVTYVTKLEIGWIAWILGGIVGLAVRVGGGRGTKAGVIAAVLAGLAICGGKIASVNLFISDAIEKEADDQLSELVYQLDMRAADNFARVTSEDQYPAFMVENHLTDAESPEQVTETELQWFADNKVEMFRKMKANQPTYQEWKEESIAVVKANVSKEYTMFDKLKGTLGLLDIVFFALGLGTAFKIAAGNE